jgi:O-antigen ligase
VWTALPGRENEIAALSLVGQEASWRPISLSPGRTIASLAAIIPPVFCLYAMSRLELHERRLVLAAIVVMAIVTSLLGAIQLTAGGAGINLYPEHHVGWVTGFQANRNAAADVLLVGLLALAVLAAPYLTGSRQRLPLSMDRRALTFLIGGTALFLLAATVMTGSRAGTMLVLVVGAAALAILLAGRTPSHGLSLTRVILLLCAALLAGLVFLVLSETTAIGRVGARFSDGQSVRIEIWKDTLFALKQYWPVGFGMGGFEPAMLPAERLEVLDPSIPNRAHNDFLEIGLEAGVLGYAMVAVIVILCISLAWRSWRQAPGMRRQIIFGLGVLMVIALHSVVDYPLRSMAVASLAGVAAGMLVINRASTIRTVSLKAPVEMKGLA